MQYTFRLQFVVQSRRNRNKVGTSVVLDQLQEISSPKLMTSKGRDVIGGIQPRFVYQSAFVDCYESVEHWEVDENTNVDVFEETKENYLGSSQYAKAQVNVLDEVLESYSH